MPLLEQLIGALEAGAPTGEQIVDAAHLCERWCQLRVGGDKAAGWSDAVAAEALSSAGIGRLHDALETFVRTAPDHSIAPSAVWAIGKLHEAHDEAFFSWCVAVGIPARPALVYQALIGLDNLELLPARWTSWAAADTEANLERGRQYLTSRER